MKILYSIDANILDSYFSQASQSFATAASLKEKNEFIVHLLDILEIRYSEDGGFYANEVKELFGLAHSEDRNQTVLEKAVEKVIVYVRNGNDPSYFRK
jgi:hypothetical protein